MIILTFVLSALREEACRSENGSSFHTLGSLLIDYCCVVWGNCSNEALNRILKLPKRTARLILYQVPITPFGPLFKQLGCMTIEQRIKYHKYLS
jgi:hypothetical protein